MSTPAKFSESNVINTLTIAFADELLANGYLVYWHAIDAIQTLGGWYYTYSTKYALYHADPAFSGQIGNAKGIVTLTEHIPAEPKFIERPITVAGPYPQNQLVVPVFSVEIGSSVAIANYELGTRLKWRNRHLVIEGYVRDRHELTKFKDLLAIIFDNETFFDVLDHDAGTLATVGQVEINDTIVDDFIDVDAAEQTTYQVICNSRLEYIA